MRWQRPAPRAERLKPGALEAVCLGDRPALVETRRSCDPAARRFRSCQPPKSIHPIEYAAVRLEQELYKSALLLEFNISYLSDAIFRRTF